MSNDYTLEVTITPTGQIESLVTGVQGPICEQLSAWLDELGEVTLDEKTPDYDRRGRTATANRLRIGG